MKTKSLELTSSEIKMDGDSHTFSGYASVFGGIDSYGDRIQKGAYLKTLESRTRPVQLRWNHYGPVIGKWVEMKEDDHGLYVRGELTPGHSTAEDAYALLQHGSVDGLSIGYRVPKGGEEEKDGVNVLSEIELIEVSIVESPADLAATIGDVKSAIEGIETIKEYEAFLRDVGRFSRADAKSLISQFKALCQRDVDAKTDTVTVDLLDAIEQTKKALNI